MGVVRETHMCGALRGQLCDSSAFLNIIQFHTQQVLLDTT